MITPVLEIQFDLNGDLAFPGQEQAVALKLAEGKIRSVVVLAHGWNKSTQEARALFRNLLAAAEAEDGAALQNALAIEVLWPSKKFDFQNPQNLAACFIMKDRAGKIGSNGLNPLLARLQSRPNIAFHLAGHGFGARLVSAAAKGCHALRIASLLLLQPACSQNGLATNFDGQGRNGLFHELITDRKITGPILVTHSATLGGAPDQFGGMAANGARHVNAVDLRLARRALSNFEKGKVFNLNGDGVIRSDADVVRPETAALLAAAVRQCAD